MERVHAELARQSPLTTGGIYWDSRLGIAASTPSVVPAAMGVSWRLVTGLRRRILQVWEYDIRAAMVEENEGGPVRDIDAGTLRDIQAARAALDSMDVGQARDGS